MKGQFLASAEPILLFCNPYSYWKYCISGTSIDKIGAVWLSDEIGEGGFDILKKTNLIITT